MRFVLFIILAVVALAAMVGGVLIYTGTVHAPWAARQLAVRKHAEGAVPAPLSFRAINAYAKVTREDLLNPETGKLAEHYIFVETNSSDPTLVDASKIINRVLRRAKEPGYTFHESDFFPEGTIPGEAAGVPVGKRAMTLDATELSGAHSARTGDHIDLIATQKVDLSKTKPGVVGLTGTVTSTEQTLAQDALVVSPVTIRQVPYNAPGTLTAPGQVRTKPVEEFTIAVDPSEVPAIARAVGSDSTIYCVLHSGQPAQSHADGNRLPSDDAKKAVMVEQIVGTKHDLKLVPNRAALTAGDPTDPSSAPMTVEAHP